MWGPALKSLHQAAAEAHAELKRLGLGTPSSQQAAAEGQGRSPSARSFLQRDQRNLQGVLLQGHKEGEYQDIWFREGVCIHVHMRIHLRVFMYLVSCSPIYIYIDIEATRARQPC